MPRFSGIRLSTELDLPPVLPCSLPQRYCVGRVAATDGYLQSTETFAAGDNFNDLPMLNLAFARFLACPSNAIEDVKETVRNQGGFVAAQDSGLGVDEALRYFFPSLL